MYRDYHYHYIFFHGEKARCRNKLEDNKINCPFFGLLVHWSIARGWIFSEKWTSNATVKLSGQYLSQRHYPPIHQQAKKSSLPNVHPHKKVILSAHSSSLHDPYFFLIPLYKYITSESANKIRVLDCFSQSG